ncbi:MAG: YbaB/EbfC family nucleoid-associated protein [Pseudomonadota bacterium]
MKDLGGLMKQAQAMQARLAEAQEELKQLVLLGTAGGGVVKVMLSGAGELKGVEIDPALMEPGEHETLADLIVAAHADARRMLDARSAELMQKAAGPLAGMKLPFG